MVPGILEKITLTLHQKKNMTQKKFLLENEQYSKETIHLPNIKVP